MLPTLPPAPTPSVSTPRPPNGALPFLTRDLLAPGPPQRLAVRQGPAGQGGVQVAGLTHWDVPSLESLHQVRLPSGAPQLFQLPPLPAPGAQAPPQASPCPPVLQMLSLGRSNRATAATAMNQRSSRSHALVTLTLRTASPSRGTGTAGTSAPESCGGLAAPTPGLRPRPARSPLQARCTSSTWRGPSAPGRRGRPVHRRKTGTAPSVYGRLGPSTARCWRWEA